MNGWSKTGLKIMKAQKILRIIVRIIAEQQEEDVLPGNSIDMKKGKQKRSKENSEKSKVISDWLDSLPKVP